MVVPAEVRAAIREHALAEQPNEACGLVLLDDSTALRYVPARNVEASPYRFKLELDPAEWADIGDSELEQAVLHSHVGSPAYPSRTDVENIGLWAGAPYLIYSIRLDELAAFTIAADGRITELPLA